MKKVDNIYSRITKLENIIYIYEHQIRPHTKNKSKIGKFENYLMCNIVDVQNILENQLPYFNRYYVFLIQEPKYRIIMSQTIRDKLINHLVAQHLLLDVYEDSFIDANVATRVGKGTHYGIKLTKDYITKLKNQNKPIYYLKCDISKYFYSIDHQILKEILARKITDKRALELIYKIIDTTDGTYITRQINGIKEREITRINGLNITEVEKEKKRRQILNIPDFSKQGVGIPIGNMTSQAFALIYLNEFDHMVKEKLQAKYYVRYMDDFVIFSTDKEYLKHCKQVMQEELETKYHLKLNPKTKISPMKNGLDFLGFRFILKDKKLILKIRTSTKRRAKHKMKKLTGLYMENKITKHDMMQVIASYQGHIRYGNTYYLEKKIFYKSSLPTNEHFGIKVRISRNGYVIHQK